MASDELNATDRVHALADAGAISMAIADRLDDNGFETIADLLIADQDDLTEVPYVGGLRADEILATVDELMSPPEPRDVDLEATESVVSEAAIPMPVRRGKAVLATSGNSGTNGKYHTTDCSIVTGNSEKLRERTWNWAEKRDLTECSYCAKGDADAHAHNATQSEEPDPLVDSREVALEATLGEKLNLTMVDRDGYACAWAVIDTEESTTWETATGDTWQTRRIRISQKMNGEEHYSECDLVVAAHEIRLEDPPVKRRSAQPNAPSWRVESVGAIGRVATSTHAQLVGKQQEQQDARPEGDDTWRKYKRGEA